ncbi:MAG: hypothetical protein K8U03_16250 [Planctomycetia bacterium]|nr:hypothetical protein [Planctomycetia bacterium]
MHQIKMFKGMESELNVLEKDVNEWLAQSRVRVIQMLGNIAPQSIPPTAKGSGLSTTEFAPSDVLFVVVYEKTT